MLRRKEETLPTDDEYGPPDENDSPECRPHRSCNNQLIADEIQRLLETCDPIFFDELQRDLRALGEAAADGVVDDSRRCRLWKDWEGFARRARCDVFLEETSAWQKALLLGAYAARVLRGDYGRGRQVGSGSVDEAIQAIGQTCQLVGGTNPTKLPGSNLCLLHLRRQLQAYKCKDPAPKPRLAVPVHVIQQLQAEREARPDDKELAAEVATIASFYLLRVAEYAAVRGKRLTQLFRDLDVIMW